MFSGDRGALYDISRDLTYVDVYRISTDESARVYVSHEVLESLGRTRERFLQYIKSGGECYGVSTGLGGMSDFSLEPGRATESLYLRILRQHAVGLGDYIPRGFVRGAMVILARQLCLGLSAVDPSVVSVIIDMLNNGIVPLVPRYGSLGASGDLAPMSYIGLSLYGEGLVEDRSGRRGLSREIMREHGIEPIRPGVKDFLSIINNTAMSTSIASHATYLADRLLASLVVVSAISIEAMATPREHFSREIATAKRSPGVRKVSEVLTRILGGSSVGERGVVQDRYSFRTVPQVLGSLYDTLVYVREAVNREINSSSDNPLFIGDRCVSGGNFYGIHIANSMDYLAHSVIQPLIQADRRIFTILDPKLSRGLPPFLAVDRDVGLMIAQYTSASLLNRISVLLYPATALSVPTSGSQEDHVSNSYNSALRTYEIMDLAMYIVAIEYLVASYALLQRPWFERSGDFVKRAVEALGDVIESLYDERPLGESIVIARRRLEEMIERESREGLLKDLLT